MDTVIDTLNGTLRGTVADGIHRFLGVPFAAPPFGANRLRPPAPVASWSGVRDATRLGAAPHQVAPPAEAADPAWDTAEGGEDCLNLNLWTPDPGATGLPVMVWIQGGMFEIGSQAAYDGAHFARDGVICLVINYRLGAEGFLYLGDGDDANLGLLDQVAALEWVRENIAAFGGDPANVTIFGESAGAMSIGTLLAMPRADGLFRRAIMQSGSAQQVMPAETASNVGRLLAEKLGVSPTREAIAALPIERLLAAQAEMRAALVAHQDAERGGPLMAVTMPFQPVVDGKVIPGPPLDLIAAGAGTTVDVMVGTNTDDWRLFLVLMGTIDQITDEMLTGPVPVHGDRALAAYGLPAETALTAYRARFPDASPGDLLARVQTDWWVRVPSIRLADARTGARSRTYMYEFDWASPEFGGLGAVHGLEIPFVFDTLSPTPPLFGPMLGATAPQDLADTMHAAWVSFAATGDPGWPPYDLGRRATMRFNTAPQVVDDPRSWERALWDGIR